MLSLYFSLPPANLYFLRLFERAKQFLLMEEFKTPLKYYANCAEIAWPRASLIYNESLKTNISINYIDI